MRLATHATDSVRLSVGIDFNRDNGASEGEVELFPGFTLPTDFELEREIVGVFGEVAWRTDAGFSVDASLRNDNPDQVKAQTTARIGAQYEFGATRFFASWGEGFKLPSFFALGNALVGNPDLRPETSSNWELGLSQSALDERLDFTITGFDNRFEDLIDFDFELFTNVNRDRVDTRGFELASTFRPVAGLQLGAYLSHTDIDVKTSDVSLRQRPEWRGGVNVDWAPLEALRIRLDWLYVGETFDSSR